MHFLYNLPSMRALRSTDSTVKREHLQRQQGRVPLPVPRLAGVLHGHAPAQVHPGLARARTKHKGFGGVQLLGFTLGPLHLTSVLLSCGTALGVKTRSCHWFSQITGWSCKGGRSGIRHWWGMLNGLAVEPQEHLISKRTKTGMMALSSFFSSYHLALFRNILSKPWQIEDSSTKRISVSLSDLVCTTLFCSVTQSTLEVIVYCWRIHISWSVWMKGW